MNFAKVSLQSATVMGSPYFNVAYGIVGGNKNGPDDGVDTIGWLCKLVRDDILA